MTCIASIQIDRSNTENGEETVVGEGAELDANDANVGHRVGSSSRAALLSCYMRGAAMRLAESGKYGRS